MGGMGLSMKRWSVGCRGKKSLNFQRLRPNNGISNENARRGEMERDMVAAFGKRIRHEYKYTYI
jgi:hypothetical protein